MAGQPVQAATSNGDEAVFTYGWDTAFAIPVPDVNRAIVDHRSSPPALAYDGQGFAVTADFGAWQVTQGGDGKNVRMLLPMTNVILTYSSGDKHTFPSGSAVIEIQLHYIPHSPDDTGTTAGGTFHALVANPTSTDPNQPVVAVIEASFEGNPSPFTIAVLKQGISGWGNANLAEFAHVFAVVNLNRIVDEGSWGWLNPNYTSYTYLDVGTVETSILGVLNMTGIRSGQSLAEQISENAIPAGSVAGFVISQERTLVDVVRPAIMATYPGLDDDNFKLSDDKTTLYLDAPDGVALAPVTHDGTTYHPVLKEMAVQASGGVVSLCSYTETPVATGFKALCTANHWYTVKLGTSSNGQTLEFVEAQKPQIVHEIWQSPGSKLTQLIIDIVAAIALVLLTILTDGAALVVGGLVIGLIMGADQIVPALIEKVNTDDSPAIDLLLVNSVHPITWTDSKDFKLDFASLNVSLQLGGDPAFV